MRVPFYDLKAQYAQLKDEMDSTILDVMASGGYMMGKHHNQFEADLAGIHGCKHGIALNSGTDALRILMDAAGIGPGDEVITTAFTFVASVETVMQTGATPVFVDIDPGHFMITPENVESAITPRTKAILPVHLFGQLCDIRAMKAIAEKHNVILLEDAAQGVLSHNKGDYAGVFGKGAGFSFYPTKNLGAAGDGGMIVTNDDAIAERCRSIRVHGMGRERYYYDYLGYTSRLAEVQAAFLGIKLKALPGWNDRRSELAAIYFDVLSDCSGVRLSTQLEGNNHTWHQFTIRAQRRDELQAHLKANEVDSMIYYPVPIHYHAPYRHLANGPGSLPITEEVSNDVLNLPIHPHLSDDQVRHAAQQIAGFYA